MNYCMEVLDYLLPSSELHREIPTQKIKKGFQIVRRSIPDQWSSVRQ